MTHFDALEQLQTTFTRAVSAITIPREEYEKTYYVHSYLWLPIYYLIRRSLEHKTLRDHRSVYATDCIFYYYKGYHNIIRILYC